MKNYIQKVLSFIYTKIIILVNLFVIFINKIVLNINNYLHNYINRITLDVANNNLDFFDKFYYNLIIFIYWTIIQLKNLIVNLIIVLNYEFKMKKIQMYELTFGNKKFPLATPTLFYSVLKNVEPNSKILDFGCGSGICYRNIDTIKLINKYNFKITGIDINKLALSKFQNKIEKNSLNDKINLIYGDILTMELKKFDYVIFSESAPLMSMNFLNKVVNHIKENLLNDNGKIIFINNLVENPQVITKFLKPKLKYFTTIDFGRVLTKNEFDEFAKSTNMNVKYELIDKMLVSDIASFYKIKFLFLLFQKFGFKNYEVSQHKITFEK